MNLPKLILTALCLAWLSPLAAGAQITFDSSFENGNGTAFTLVSGTTYSFEIEQDTNSTDRQWYYFAVSGAQGQTLTFRLLNTDDTNVFSHWNTAVPVFSTDGGTTWARIAGATSHNSTVYEFTHSFTVDNERLAFHDPYTFTYFESRMPAWAAHPHVEASVLGQSPGGHDIHFLRVTDPAQDAATKLGFWVLGRQHAGEVTGSHSVDGFIEYLLSDEDDARALRAGAVVNIVPFMNPDGAIAGNYRDNGQGINLNRVWDGTATAVSAPEVFLVEQAIAAWVSGGNSYDGLFDFHSTSGTNPHFAFHASATIPGSSVAYNAESEAFLALVNSFAPHFNPTQGESNSNGNNLAYHDARRTYGVQAFTPEGAYNNVNFGPNSSDFMTVEEHRLTGEAWARALVSKHGLVAPPSAASSWVEIQ